MRQVGPKFLVQALSCFWIGDKPLRTRKPIPIRGWNRALARCQVRKAHIERRHFRSQSEQVTNTSPQLEKGRNLSVLKKLCPVFWGERLAFGFELRLGRRVERGRWGRPSCDASSDRKKEVFLSCR